MERERVLVVGGTGRTGARLVQRLRADPSLQVSVLARDRAKAAEVLGGSAFAGAQGSVGIVQGDLLDLDPWAYHLDEVDVIVTAVSCGVRTDPYVLLGLRPKPGNMPYAVDGDGIAQLSRAAREHGVRRIVAVTTASTGTPWSLAAIFLNSVCFMSVKWKFFGEQAIRDSGLEYVVIRPFGLVDTTPGEATGLNVEFSQGKTEGTGRRIPREDVARLCHEAVRAPTARATFECWSGPAGEAPRAFPWASLRPDGPGRLAEVNHDVAVGAAAAAVTGTVGLAATGTYRLARRLLRAVRR